MENLARSASFHSGEETAPPKPGTKHLAIASAPNGSAVVDSYTVDVSDGLGGVTAETFKPTIMLAAGGMETVTNPTGSGTFTLGATQLTINETSATTFSGIIQDGSSGTGGSVVVAGNAALTLSGANTFTGGTQLTGGEIILGSNAALSTGTLAMSPGTTLGCSASGLTLANAITVSGDPTYTVTTGQTDTASGAITDLAPTTNPGIVEKAGGGTLRHRRPGRRGQPAVRA